MKESIVKIGAILIGVVALSGQPSTAVSAQRGGKAEPGRIQFKRGATSAVMTGTVRGDEEAEYVVEARAGQSIHLQVESTPRNSAVVSKVAEEGGRSLPLKNEGPGRWSVRLDESSDYIITVTKTHPDRSTARYKLRVEIPNN